MKNICRTCGGECVLVREESGVSQYRCTCCDNLYFVRKGEKSPFADSDEVRPNPGSRFAGAARRVKPPVCGEGSLLNKKRNVFVSDRADEVVPQEIKDSADGLIGRPNTGDLTVARNSLGGEDIYSMCIDSVLEVRASFGKTVLSGSGFAIGGEYAVTNAHVVTEKGSAAEKIEVYACGKTCRAQTVFCGFSQPDGEDLALLRISDKPDGLKPVKFAEYDNLKNGQRLYVIGNSLGDGTCITSGIVSDRRRMLAGKPRLMTDCAVNRGNSGGPVFNERGEVAGTIVAVTAAAEGMNYAIPSDVVQKFIADSGAQI